MEKKYNRTAVASGRSRWRHIDYEDYENLVGNGNVLYFNRVLQIYTFVKTQGKYS